MAYVFQTHDKLGKAHPRWRFQFTDRYGRRRTATGTTSKTDTTRLATRVEAEEYDIRKGIRTAPTPSIKARNRSFREVADEHIAWGKAQGGRGGRPWSATHSRMRIAQLQWWQNRLHLTKLGDLENVLPAVEAALRQLKESGRAGKTVQNYAETLHGFCRWCCKRKYLDEDPLSALSPFDKSPETERRAMTLSEINRLLAVVPADRQLLYLTALCSGLRAGELRALSVADLDVQGGGVHLRPEWTKNRKPGFQPLPARLLAGLADFAAAGTALKLYRRAYVRRDARHGIPTQPLLYSPANTARAFSQDLKKAGIPKLTQAGKLDFHALRVTYVTRALQAGAYVKEAQVLARHSDPRLTMNIYGKTAPERLTQIVETIGQPFLRDTNLCLPCPMQK